MDYSLVLVEDVLDLRMRSSSLASCSPEPTAPWWQMPILLVRRQQAPRPTPRAPALGRSGRGSPRSNSRVIPLALRCSLVAFLAPIFWEAHEVSSMGGRQ